MMRGDVEVQLPVFPCMRTGGGCPVRLSSLRKHGGLQILAYIPARRLFKGVVQVRLLSFHAEACGNPERWTFRPCFNWATVDEAQASPAGLIFVNAVLLQVSYKDPCAANDLAKHTR